MKRPHGDDGVYAILYVALTLVVVSMASFVVDLGLLRADKRESRNASDNAALAGARDLGVGPYAPRAACSTAWDYALDNLGLLDDGTDPCALATPSPGFRVSEPNCIGIVARTASRPVGDAIISVTWPVGRTSELLLDPDGKPSGINRTYNKDFDGTEPGCDRMAVSVTRRRSLGIATALGAGSGATYAASVARSVLKPGDSVLPYPLVILDEFSCNALAVSGGPAGVPTNVLVRRKGDTPGRIGIDSNGTSSGNEANTDGSTPPSRDACSGQAKIVKTNGSNAFVQASDGVSGAKGAIELYGPSSLPVRSHDGNVNPIPTVRSTRITRAPFDQQFNCGTTCLGGSPTKAYVDRFRDAANLVSSSSATELVSAGWTAIDNADSCSKTPPPPAVSPPKYFVNCGTYTVTGDWAFPPGSIVVISGDLLIKGGCLVVNAAASACAPTAATPYGGPNALVSVSGRVYGSQGSPKLVLPQTFLHQRTKAAKLSLSGFDTVSWSAPYVAESDMATQCPPPQPLPSMPPAACFRNLAYWSEYPGTDSQPIDVTSATLLRMDGTYFMGNSKLKMSGGGTIDIENAQFVAKRIEAFGGGELSFTPNPDRTVRIPSVGVSLIR